MRVSQSPAPGADAHRRPWRPRPAVCSSATISVPEGASGAIACATSSVEPTSSNNSTRGRPSRREISSAVAPSMRVERASAKDKEIHDGEHHPIPAERREVVLLDVAKERLDGDDRGDEADDESDRQDAVVAYEARAALHQLQAGRREHCG